MSQIGFGVVGAGLIAPFHLKAIRDSIGGRIIGIFDIEREKSQNLASQFNAKAYTSLDEMLQEDSVNAVCVATPNHLHKNTVLAAAKAGKHILTEKPPAMSLKDTDEMIEACNTANVKFGCFVQCRTRKAIQKLKEVIVSGRIGKLLRADAYMKWYRPMEYYSSAGWRSERKSGSGVTVAQGFHYIDLLQYLAGPAAEIEAKMTNIAHPGIELEDDVLAHIKYANGAYGVVQLSTALWPGTDIRIEINGTDGTAVMSGETIQVWKFKDSRPEDKDIYNIGNPLQATGAGGAADLGHYDHTTVVQDMINCIKTGNELFIPVSGVRATLEIILGMYQSAKLNSPVKLPLLNEDNVW